MSGWSRWIGRFLRKRHNLVPFISILSIALGAAIREVVELFVDVEYKKRIGDVSFSLSLLILLLLIIYFFSNLYQMLVIHGIAKDIRSSYEVEFYSSDNQKELYRAARQLVRDATRVTIVNSPIVSSTSDVSDEQKAYFEELLKKGKNYQRYLQILSTKATSDSSQPHSLPIASSVEDYGEDAGYKFHLRQITERLTGTGEKPGFAFGEAMYEFTFVIIDENIVIIQLNRIKDHMSKMHGILVIKDHIGNIVAEFKNMADKVVQLRRDQEILEALRSFYPDDQAQTSARESDVGSTQS